MRKCGINILKTKRRRKMKENEKGNTFQSKYLRSNQDLIISQDQKVQCVPVSFTSHASSRRKDKKKETKKRKEKTCLNAERQSRKN